MITRCLRRTRLVYLRILIYLLQALLQTSIRPLQSRGLIAKASILLHLQHMHPAILLGRPSHLLILQEVSQQHHNALTEAIQSVPMLSECELRIRGILNWELEALGAWDLVSGCT